MTNKTLFRLAALAMIPQCVITLAFGTIAVSHLLGGEEILRRVIDGSASYTIIAVMGLLAIFGLAVNLTATIIMVRYTDDIDRLEKSQKEYREAVERLNAMTNKLRDHIVESKNKQS
jgi:hypothetical protein